MHSYISQCQFIIIFSQRYYFIFSFNHLRIQDYFLEPWLNPFFYSSIIVFTAPPYARSWKHKNDILISEGLKQKAECMIFRMCYICVRCHLSILCCGFFSHRPGFCLLFSLQCSFISLWVVNFSFNHSSLNHNEFPSVSLIYLLLNIYLNIYLFEREGGGGGEQERKRNMHVKEKNWWVASHTCPDLRLNPELWHVLQSGFELATFCFAGLHSTNWAYQSELNISVF